MIDLPKTIRLTTKQRQELNDVFVGRDVACGVLDELVSDYDWPDNTDTQEACEAAEAYVQKQLAEDRILIIMSEVQYYVWRWIFSAIIDDSSTSTSQQLRVSFVKTYNFYFGDEP